MRIMVTGGSGTIGTKLCAHLRRQGNDVFTWDRLLVPYNDYWAMENHLKSLNVQALYHLATPSTPTGVTNESWNVNYQWTSELAWLCKSLGIDFIFTSTVMVFSSQNQGPFSPTSKPDAGEGYGMEKRLAEERVFQQNPQSKVIRLGWQIGEDAGSNNMVDFIETKQRSDGLIACSTQWIPACSFLDDTVCVLDELLQLPGGLYQFDSNEKWNFYQIAFALNQLHGRKWRITATDNFVFDQRMQDDRIKPRSLKTHLTTLR